MKEKDIASKRLEEYPDVFADILNTLAFGGTSCLEAANLEAYPTNGFYRDQDARWRENTRDVAKIDKRNGLILSLLTIENQTEVDPDMVFRVMGYDYASYRKQLDGEDSRRFPVATLVLYFGERTWNAPCTIVEAVSWENQEIRGKILSQDTGGGVSMKTVGDIWLEEWEKSRQEGLQEGRQEGLLEGLQEGRQEGLQEGQRRIVRFMAQKETDLEKIAASTGLSLEEVRSLLVPAGTGCP